MTDIGTMLGSSTAAGRRAKIVCTIGPASNTEPVLRELVRAGMDVARLNFSHGSHDDHARVIERVRKAAEKEGRGICIMQDLQGPKIRTGKLRDKRPIMLRADTPLVITPRDILGEPGIISTTFKTLAREVEPGSRILLADGLIELRVTAVRGDDIETEVVNGGLLGENKGINLPGAIVQVPALTEKDEKDLAFGLKQGVNAIAASFVRTAEDVRMIKARIQQFKSDAWVIAKLEKPQAIEHLDEILQVADGVMVARGDLGVELPAEKVPIIQKHVIARAEEDRKPVITATQMLESMIEHPRPTRAEASDVANAIFDGTDAVMLSGETASGKYPVEAVKTMARIVTETERHMATQEKRRRRQSRRLSISETICESIAHAAEDLEMAAIAVFTESGTTARLISKYRPRTGIYAFTSLPHVYHRLNLLWGVHPQFTKHVPTAEAMVDCAEATLKKMDCCRDGDVIGVVAGTQTKSGSTNFMRLHVVGSGSGPAPKRKPSAGRSNSGRKGR